MLIEMILNAVFGVINSVTGWFPDLSFIDPLYGQDFTPLMTVMSVAFFIFPNWLFRAFVVSFVTWKGIQISWAMIEWVYKKIPGVNFR